MARQRGNGYNIDAKISDQWSWTWIVPRGSCQAGLGEKGELTVRLEPGSGSLVIVGANDYPSGVLATERILRQGAESLLPPTRRIWNEFYDGEDHPVRNSIRANVWASGINAAVLLESLARSEAKPGKPVFKPVKQSELKPSRSK